MQEQNNTFEIFKNISKNWDETKDGIENISEEMDKVICDIYNGLPHPEYLLNNAELAKNMTFINDVSMFLIYL